MATKKSRLLRLVQCSAGLTFVTLLLLLALACVVQSLDVYLIMSGLAVSFTVLAVSTKRMDDYQFVRRTDSDCLDRLEMVSVVMIVFWGLVGAFYEGEIRKLSASIALLFASLCYYSAISTITKRCFPTKEE